MPVWEPEGAAEKAAVVFGSWDRSAKPNLGDGVLNEMAAVHMSASCSGRALGTSMDVSAFAWGVQKNTAFKVHDQLSEAS